MRTFAPQQKPTQKATSASSARARRVLSGHSREGSTILNLQRTIGNQAVQRLLRANTTDLGPGSTPIPSPRLSHGSCRIPLQAKAQTEIQPQLTISTPGDRYEQEADRVAEQVMRMPEPKIQRLCAECEDELQRAPIEEEADDTVQTQRRLGQPPAASSSLQNRITALQGGGQPLPQSERVFFEPRFGADFSHVRVHADSQASEAASAVNARAFTVGRDIVFGAGHYQPRASEGRRLLAHELTHVVQQGQGAGQSLVQKTGRGSRQLVDTTYTVEQAMRLLDSAFSLVPGALEDTEIPESQRRSIQLLYERLRTVYEQLEHARETGDSSSIVPEFDTTPEANEINAGDANRSVTELYSPFPVSASVPTAQQPALELQGKFVNNSAPRITQIPSGHALVQRVACGGICVAIVVLGGLLLAGCSRSSSGPMRTPRLQRAQQNFDDNHGHLDVQERTRIHAGLRSAVGSNIHLLVTFYDEFSNRRIVHYSRIRHGRWEANTLAQKVYGQIAVRPRILQADFSSARLGALLMHEFVHTTHPGSTTLMGSPLEGQAYGVEYYLAERNGDWDRWQAIRDLVFPPGDSQSYPSSLVVPAAVPELHRNFCQYYGAMRALYTVIDGLPPFPGFPALTSDRARALTAGLISSPTAEHGAELRQILTWVHSRRNEVGFCGFPQNMRPPSHSRVERVGRSLSPE